jgi:hypothetical protein
MTRDAIFIEDGFDLIAERCIELKTLKICNNKIKDINQINFLLVG